MYSWCTESSNQAESSQNNVWNRLDILRGKGILLILPILTLNWHYLRLLHFFPPIQPQCGKNNISERFPATQLLIVQERMRYFQFQQDGACSRDTEARLLILYYKSPPLTNTTANVISNQKDIHQWSLSFQNGEGVWYDVVMRIIVLPRYDHDNLDMWT